MTRVTLPVLVLAAILLVGCYRTHYTNLRPDSAPAVSTSPARVGGWQSFWVYGWAPGELVIGAAEKCGGSDNVASIRTERRFVQGLIAAFAGYYINIYSPWDGAVYCREEPPEP